MLLSEDCADEQCKEESPGQEPTMLVCRLTSLLTRSNGLVAETFRQQ